MSNQRYPEEFKIQAVKKLPRSKRDLIYKVIDSPSPLELVGFLADYLDD